jgi:hypothetical protein
MCGFKRCDREKDLNPQFLSMRAIGTVMSDSRQHRLEIRPRIESHHDPRQKLLGSNSSGGLFAAWPSETSKKNDEGQGGEPENEVKTHEQDRQFHRAEDDLEELPLIGRRPEEGQSNRDGDDGRQGHQEADGGAREAHGRKLLGLDRVFGKTERLLDQPEKS